MNILYRTGLLGLAAVACLIAMGPVLFVVASAATVVGLFALAVAVVAVVLLGERWIDEGLKGYSFLDALDDAFHEVVKSILRTVYRAKGVPARVRAALPTIRKRSRVVVGVSILPVAIPLFVILEGIAVVRKDLKGFGNVVRSAWARA